MSGSHSGQRCRSPKKLQMISVLAAISALRSHGAIVWQGDGSDALLDNMTRACAQIANRPEHEIGVRQNLFCPIKAA